jgi:hypothetical protein
LQQRNELDASRVSGKFAGGLKPVKDRLGVG